MSLETKFIIFQIFIILPFIAGSSLKNRIKNRDVTAKRIINFSLVSFEPVIVLWSIWGLNINIEYINLRIAGLLLALSGLLTGRLFIPFLKFSGTNKATYLISSSLANHGFTMGGFLCYLLFGETGLGLSFIFILYALPYIFLFIFSYARISSSGGLYNKKFIVKLLFNFRNIPLFAALAAILLHFIGISRPDITFPIDIILMISISLYYFTLGINFNLRDIKIIKAEHFTLAFSKFIFLPALTYLILQNVDLGNRVESIILIQSFMPAAVYSVLSSILFDLNSRLASGLFVINTIIFISLVLPILFIFKKFLFF